MKYLIYKCASTQIGIEFAYKFLIEREDQIGQVYGLSIYSNRWLRVNRSVFKNKKIEKFLFAEYAANKILSRHPFDIEIPESRNKKQDRIRQLKRQIIIDGKETSLNSIEELKHHG